MADPQRPARPITHQGEGYRITVTPQAHGGAEYAVEAIEGARLGKVAVGVRIPDDGHEPYVSIMVLVDLPDKPESALVRPVFRYSAEPKEPTTTD
jgi:hypothetical protein